MRIRLLILALAAFLAVPAAEAAEAAAEPRRSTSSRLVDHDDQGRAARTRPRSRDDDRFEDRDEERRRAAERSRRGRDRDDDRFDDRDRRHGDDGWQRRGRGSRRGPSHVPPGHLPPPGYCRDWRPGVPPGHQPPPRPCGSFAFPFLGGGHGVVLHELPRYRQLDDRDLARILGGGVYRRLEDEVRRHGLRGRLGGVLDVRGGDLRLDLGAGGVFLGRLVDSNGDWVIDEVRPSDQLRHRSRRR